MAQSKILSPLCKNASAKPTRPKKNSHQISPCQLQLGYHLGKRVMHLDIEIVIALFRINGIIVVICHVICAIYIKYFDLKKTLTL